MSAPAAAFFDLDRTVIATSSSTAFSGPLHAGGVLGRRDVLRAVHAQLAFLGGRADAAGTERLRRRVSAMVVGWDVARVQAIVAEAVQDRIGPTVHAEALALIEEHHAAGRDVVVVSASGTEVVEPIARLLGADHVVATRLQVVDGRYTGGIDFYAYGPAKATAVRDLAAREGYDLSACYAYSDSATDLPMLEVVGHPAVVNPDRTLRRTAVVRGWDVLRFQRPVALRPTVRAPGRGTLAITVALAVALLAARRLMGWARPSGQ